MTTKLGDAAPGALGGGGMGVEGGGSGGGMQPLRAQAALGGDRAGREGCGRGAEGGQGKEGVGRRERRDGGVQIWVYG